MKISLYSLKKHLKMQLKIIKWGVGAINIYVKKFSHYQIIKTFKFFKLYQNTQIIFAIKLRGDWLLFDLNISSILGLKLWSWLLENDLKSNFLNTVAKINCSLKFDVLIFKFFV